jgi:dCTP deaminase
VRRNTVLDPCEENHPRKFTSSHFVPFKTPFYLHPNRFYLASTLEWIRLPSNLSATILGKSTNARMGIMVEAAPIVHPGFSGCLTLEITNFGELPIALYPSMYIAQLVIHKVEEDLGGENTKAKSGFIGQRKPLWKKPGDSGIKIVY